MKQRTITRYSIGFKQQVIEQLESGHFGSISEARTAIEAYVNYYNGERIHSALGYRTPNEVVAAYNTLVAA
ncbi:integrase core domain-containing protein [Planctomycetota bacterium]